MSCPKRPLDGQDPDYEDSIPHETKRLRLLEENAKVEFSERICNIIQREFGMELEKREKEVLEIQERLQQAQKTLHMLRYVVVSSFYDKKQMATEEKQRPIHPAVKKLIGKEPRNWEPLNQRPSKYRPVASSAPPPEKSPQERVSKVPRYIPPKTNPGANTVTPTSPRRGMRHKVKKRIVIGNISKWVPVDTREDAASHKWMMYVRGPKEAPDVSGFISKVRFFLHPSYRPHDIAEVTSSPFHLSRRGWGEFPVRVQIHFTDPRNKPVDLIHHLKLDRTYTGLQTLGAETVLDIWLHSGPDKSTSVESVPSVSEVDVKVEFSEQTVEVPSLSVTESVGSTEEESIWSITDDNIGAVEEVVNPVKLEDSVERTEVVEGGELSTSVVSPVVNSAMPTPDHDYIANPAPAATKLTTLVKCMDKNGHVFYLTLGKVNNKPQSQVKLVPEQTSILRRKLTTPVATPPKTENGNNQSLLIVKNGQLYLLNLRGGIRSVLKKQVKTEEELKLPATSRTLVLNKQTSRQMNISNRMRYEEALSRALSASKFPDVALSVRWLLRHMPLIQPAATDPEYRVVHPYAAPNDDTFLKWNVGKQRAAEWLRAKAVQAALHTQFPEESVWGVRAIVVWARMHGYCPMPPREEITIIEPKSSSFSTYSEPVRIMDWLVTAQKSDADTESDNEIDVISIQPGASKVKLKEEPQVSCDIEMLSVDAALEPLCLFVRDAAREAGYKLEPEELAPGVMSCAAEHILAEAVQLLADDLLRRSLCQAWIRNANKPPDCIQVEDVRLAILQRSEMDIFSNRGLGVQITDTS